MSPPIQPFYGCLCLETASSGNSLAQASARGVDPEVHFNIWEEGIDTTPFLDIGVMLDATEPAENIEIFLPWPLDRAKIEDLSARILGSNGVSAIFNEVWASATSPSTPGGAVTRSNGSLLAIIPLDQPEVKVRQTTLGVLHSIVLTVKQLRDGANAVCQATAQKNAQQMYVRFRVKDVPQHFYRVGIDQGDAFGGGALNRTEIIDFRVNVRRGVPPTIEAILHGRFVQFSKVQLFLMKSRDQDIVFEDKLFRGMSIIER
ncbi:hypothetical protein [Pseudorhodoferax sp. Leaf267]|uniref:hypothetical protein n=1 Tax=Pseudorhodoferax sp. Leaf267 TaxID=1736316 RepID=UPI0012E2748F|nr:hypothetical protein [Pseudorhodoferax sp. Leaf267]